MATSRLCSIPDCGKPYAALGYCHRHYSRLRRQGHPYAEKTEWGEGLKYLEETVLTYEGDECLTWPYSRTKRGYAKVRVNGKTKMVSRLVCERKDGPAPSPKHHAAHSCGNGHLACVTKRHVSWKSPAANASDKLLHGTDNRGTKNHAARLTDVEVREIRCLRGTVTQRALSERYGISQSLISMIQLGKLWTSIE